MNLKKSFIGLVVSGLLFHSGNAEAQNQRADGYKGIWFTLGQFSEYGDKYSGGLGTYTADHLPLAIYSPEVKKTFFVYGGTTKADERHLLIMISYYDHQKKIVPKPVIVYDKEGVNDPHDDAAICIDENGFIWVFVSGRMTLRPGLIFRSTKPYSIDGFEKILVGEMTYPQPWWIKDEGFLYLFTKYTNGRELYWSTSRDGIKWEPDRKLAGLGGHYQVTNMFGKKLVSVFNYHPGGNVDKRTNLYAVQTEDLGKTWKTIDGKQITTPLTEIHNGALIKDFEAEHKLVYINDLGFDKEGNPVILAIISNDFRPGPQGDPREWMIFHWKNNKWNIHKVCESTHNYDMGSLYIEKGLWRIIGPTEPGPQKYGAGGEMAMWESTDEGVTWKKIRNITANSIRNNSYARRPLKANDEFYSFWADGNPDRLSESHLYFTSKSGEKVMQLPYLMNNDFEKPVPLNPAERDEIRFPVIAPESVKSPLFSVKINGKEIFTNHYKTYNYIHFETTRSFSVSFSSIEPVSDLKVSPYNLKVNPVINGRSSEFILPGPGYYVIRINNKEKLFIFADLPDNEIFKEGVKITDLGVTGTGTKVETVAIQTAINSMAGTGKTLVFPAGVYKSGSLTIPSGSRIFLSDGALLKGVDDLSAYPYRDSIKLRSFIWIKDASNVEIRGRGIIDANGKILRGKYGDEARMRLLLILKSKNVTIDGIIMRDPGSWNTHILSSENVDLRNIKLLNDIDLSNTDGFDPDASKHVTIDHCFAYCSDDNVAVKITGSSGFLQNAEDIMVRNCLFLTKKSSLKVGTESLGETMKNIFFVNNDVVESDRGMSLYCSDGATFENIRYVNNRFEDNWPDAKQMGMNFTVIKRNPGSKAGQMKNILIKDCSFAGSFPKFSEIYGFDNEHTIRISIENLWAGGKLSKDLNQAQIKSNSFTNISIR
jgi:hypothetical protein